MMNRNALAKDVKTDPERVKILAIGGVLGALIGLAGAYLYAQNSDMHGRRPQMTAGDGVRLGLLVLGLLRSVATLGDE